MTSDQASRNKWRPSFEYDVDYNDHFETPRIAYEDISFMLDAAQPNRKRDQVVLYDPYYCNGRTKTLLNELGYMRVEHRKRDFYKDVESNSVPNHNVLITNPPYSDNHKIRCLEICSQRFQEYGIPFFLLMPAYVATKGYYKAKLKACFEDIVYLVPSTPYLYDHPEGTGHEVSPFESLWFCCVGRSKKGDFTRCFNATTWPYARSRPRIIYSYDDLIIRGVISGKRRPNPKQRRKRRLEQLTSPGKTKRQPRNEEKLMLKVNQPAKSSKYRDANGKRVKQRF